MIKINKLDPDHYLQCYQLLSQSFEEMMYFGNLGWSLNQIKMQLLKDGNLSVGLFNNDKIDGFVIGNLLSIEKKTEYEILLVYVNFLKRRLGYALKILEKIPIILSTYNLNKIYLEVASNNISAINLYKKSNYIKSGIRKNYYLVNNNRIDAILYEKKIDE